MKSLPIYTIGHSTRTLDEFTAVLAEAQVVHLVDVRTVPRSRTNPQFNGDTLPAALAGLGIAYRHAADLGGLRPKSRTIAPEVNGYWTNDSFHNYADYALSAPFVAALAELMAGGCQGVTAIMCAEAVWWRCHRRIVADHLLAHQTEVIHLMERGHPQPASLTPGAVIQSDRSVTYPGDASPAL